MARSFSNAKFLSAFIVDGVSAAVNRRGYATASQAVVVRGGGSRSGMMATKQEEVVSPKSSWIPDPETGFYKPENQSNQIDAAELREMLLKQKTRRH